MRERMWLASTSSARVSPAARRSARFQLPTATTTSDAANASGRHTSRWASKAGWVTSAFLLFPQRFLETRAGARQPRHHRADRHARDVADFLVRQPFELAQHDHLAEFRR